MDEQLSSVDVNELAITKALDEQSTQWQMPFDGMDSKALVPLLHLSGWFRCCGPFSFTLVRLLSLEVPTMSYCYDPPCVAVARR
eukprot:m.148739 g.148739  ORF g.148739 m.148739 type:complete len:84 (+) comp14190_c0_seq6:191-442(+)